MNLSGPKFRVLLLRREGGVLQVSRTKTLRSVGRTTRVKFGFRSKASYAVDWSSPLYVRGQTRVYALLETGEQVTAAPGDAPGGITPEELDVIMGSRIVRELASGVGRDASQMLLPIILGAAVGFLAAWIIASVVYEQRVDQLIQALSGEQALPFPAVGAFVRPALEVWRWAPWVRVLAAA